MFRDITYLKSGSNKQRLAYQAIMDTEIWNRLSSYTPVLCGTIPIGIDTAASDLDIIMEVSDFPRFEDEVVSLYGKYAGFRIKEKSIRGMPVIKANFTSGGFHFELFGQPQAVHRQHAYRHMLVEHHLLLKHPSIKASVLSLKENGIKTEPAFAQVMGLTGDPYEELLALGIQLGLYSE
ncbi:DUF4269 domain-containing protein [Paenibacillus sp. sgz500958]|uniref:DUF4269 domain-containing protein n=1 Tax=Paenibacillus sp. sgz500958 TaxID=3242475 RepID=UPI0036D21971